ncbi:DEAD/DEAH box helicase [Flavobacterium gelatinilyticum]|uniref:SNF2-related protein n=1 Tax=Flavobacterium gelatinilyticum TaxID=3003260 RepID=UPI00248124CC|nr:DEAD/DEAH box helicase [Flavobacterium gelatinilyticum]
MKIDLDINKIILIDNTEDLKKYQISQLNYYGYLQSQNIWNKESNSTEADILKIIEYFDQENILYDLSENVNYIVSKNIEEKRELDTVILLAKKIKEEAVLDNSFDEFKAFSETLPRKLKPHQLKSAFHFYTLKNGANFSVPGSGKTSTILSVYEKLRLEGKCNLLFIVGPPSCFQPWQHEFNETLGRKPSFTILSGGNQSFRKSEYYRSQENAHELYLSTFHTALNDSKDIITFFSQINLKAFLIIDEAHYIKQLGGSWANSLLEIGKKAAYKGILTGTPIPKSYKDIFNLFDFLWQENSPLSQDDKIQIGTWEKNKKNENIKNLLENNIGPLFYRVRKKDLGLIPAIFHEPIIVPMKRVEKKIYESIKAKIFELDRSDYFRNEDILNKLWKGRMMRLRQAVSYPKLLLSAVDNYTEKFIENSDLKLEIKNYDDYEISGKLEALEKLVMTIRNKGEKVLIWSNFIGTLNLIKSHFNSIGQRAELIYGKTPVRKDDIILVNEEKTREDIRDEFLDMESGLNILIANPAACAESISLHKSCFHAVYYDLSYNGAQYLQSLDRIHRVGGSEINEANYYFLQYENSIDQDIKKNLEAKAEKMYDIIEQDYNIYDLDIYQDNDEDDIEAYKRLLGKK